MQPRAHEERTGSPSSAAPDEASAGAPNNNNTNNNSTMLSERSLPSIMISSPSQPFLQAAEGSGAQLDGVGDNVPLQNPNFLTVPGAERAAVAPAAFQSTTAAQSAPQPAAAAPPASNAAAPLPARADAMSASGSSSPEWLKSIRYASAHSGRRVLRATASSPPVEGGARPTSAPPPLLSSAQSPFVATRQVGPSARRPVLFAEEAASSAPLRSPQQGGRPPGVAAAPSTAVGPLTATNLHAAQTSYASEQALSSMAASLPTNQSAATMTHMRSSTRAPSQSSRGSASSRGRRRLRARSLSATEETMVASAAQGLPASGALSMSSYRGSVGVSSRRSRSSQPTSRTIVGPSTSAAEPTAYSFTVTETVRPPPQSLKSSDMEFSRRPAIGGGGTANPLNIWRHEGNFFKGVGSGLRRQFGPKTGAATATAGPPVERLSNSAPEWASEARQSSHVSSRRIRHHLSTLYASEVVGKDAAFSASDAQSSAVTDVGGSDGGGDSGGGSSPTGTSEDSEAGGGEKNFWDEMDENFNGRTYRTRNLNALRAFSWDQRVFLPTSAGYLTSFFTLLASPRFWEKFDWTVRGSILTILPTLILCLEPRSRSIFPLPTAVVSLAFWISQPTLGAGLREFFVVLKGFSLSLVVLCIIIAINPGPPWLSLIILFCVVLMVSFIAEQTRRTCAYCLTSLLMQYISSPSSTGFKYVGDYYTTLLIALGFGLGAFFIPYIRWSSDVAQHYIAITGDSISLSVRGMCASFWVHTAVERRLNLSRLRQLQSTIEVSAGKAAKGLSESGYEPHTGVYTAQLRTRMTFFKNMSNMLNSMQLVIEQLAESPQLIDTPLCRDFGKAIKKDLAAIATAMDTTLLRISDINNRVTAEELNQFRLAKQQFENAIASVREKLILNNDAYETGDSDILLGFFLFAIEEMCDYIASFAEAANPPNNLIYLLTFPVRDVESTMYAYLTLFISIYRRHTITRRMKEAIKLSLIIIIAAFFQVYALDNAATSPVAGVSIIALIYNNTGAMSFQYSTNRLLGTVLGSLTGLLCVQIAHGRRWVLYILSTLLNFIGMYVESSPGFYPLGNAICNSVISIVISYTNTNSAMIRIQQNCFAILIYFIIASIIWPMRGRTKLKLGFDISLRMLREAAYRLLHNLDMPESAKEVSDDAVALLGEMQKRIGVQQTHLPGAIAEPAMDSAEFPDLPWRMVISAQKRLYYTLLTMRYAYKTFMTSTAGDGIALSVHWVVLHRIAPYANMLAELINKAIAIYLLTVSKVTFIPTSHLSGIRQGMIRCHREIINVYISTIQHEVAGEGSDEDGYDSEDDMSGSAQFSRGADASVSAAGGAAAAATPTTSAAGADAGKPADTQTVDPPAAASKPAGGAADSSRADTATNPPGDDTQKPRKRKNGYLAYKLTPEEQAALRNFIDNGSFTGNATLMNASFFQTNASFTAANSSAPHTADAHTARWGLGSRRSSMGDRHSLTPGPLQGTFAGVPAGTTTISRVQNETAPSRHDARGADLFDFGPTRSAALRRAIGSEHGSMTVPPAGGTAPAQGGTTAGVAPSIANVPAPTADTPSAPLNAADYLGISRAASARLRQWAARGRAASRLHHEAPTNATNTDAGGQGGTPPRPDGTAAAAARSEHGSPPASTRDTVVGVSLGGPEARQGSFAASKVGAATAPGAPAPPRVAPSVAATAPNAAVQPPAMPVTAHPDEVVILAPTPLAEPPQAEVKKKGTIAQMITKLSKTANYNGKAVTDSVLYDSSGVAVGRAALGHLDDSDAEEDETGLGATANLPRALEDASRFNESKGEFILTNRDIHSLEAFLFGIRALITQIGDLERELLSVQYATEVAKKL